jgi:hypothetical protein
MFEWGTGEGSVLSSLPSVLPPSLPPFPELSAACDGVCFGRVVRRVNITGGHGGGVGPLFSQQFRFPILERKQKFVLRWLGFDGGQRYQAAYRFLLKLRPFESDRAEGIVAGGWCSEDRVRKEEENKRAWK